MEKRNVGDMIAMEGPKGFLKYLGHGKFVIREEEKTKTKVGFIAGGTGITPCF